VKRCDFISTLAFRSDQATRVLGQFFKNFQPENLSFLVRILSTGCFSRSSISWIDLSLYIPLLSKASSFGNEVKPSWCYSYYYYGASRRWRRWSQSFPIFYVVCDWIWNPVTQGGMPSLAIGSMCCVFQDRGEMWKPTTSRLITSLERSLAWVCQFYVARCEIRLRGYPS